MIGLFYVLAVVQPEGAVQHTFMVTPVTEEAAATEFAETCLASGLDFATLEEILSRKNYRRKPSTLDGLRENWDTTTGKLSYVRQILGHSELPLPECNQTMFTTEPLDVERLRRALESVISARLQADPVHESGAQSESWAWRASNGTSLRLYRMFMEEGSNQIELSLQTDTGYSPPTKERR